MGAVRQMIEIINPEEVTPEAYDRYNACKIDLSQNYPLPQKMVSLDNAPICTRGNFSFVIGLPGAKKSYLCSGIAAAYMNDNGCMGLENPNGTGKLLWVDTEQAKGHVHAIAERLNRLTGAPELLNNPKIPVIALREIPIRERLTMIVTAIKVEHPDFIVIDGIADLITNPNDPEQSTELVADIMRITSEYDCHVLTVIHCNVGSEKARGHLGSECLRKAETAISVYADGDISVCKYQKTRGIKPPEFAFGVSDRLPVSVNYQPKKPTKKESDFSSIMPSSPVSYTELTRMVMDYYGIKDSAAKKRIAAAKDNKTIVVNNIGYYHLPAIGETNYEMPF